MSDERCEISDLIKSQCGHCQGTDALVPAAQTSDKPLLGKVVEAKFQGWCGECPEPILIGDMIAKADDDPEGPWIHYGCGR